mgnify:CR=1 FL=1
MAIEKMKKLRLLAVRDQKKVLLRKLMLLGCIEVSEPELSELSPELRQHLAKEGSDVTKCRTDFATLVQAVELLDKYAPQKSKLLSAKPETEVGTILDDSTLAATIETARRIVSVDESVRRANAERARLAGAMDSLKPWLALDYPLDGQGTQRCAVTLGFVPASVSLAEVSQSLAEVTEEAEIISVSADKTQRYLALVCFKEDLAAALDALRVHNFSIAAFGNAEGTAAENTERLKAELEELDRQKGELIDEICAMAECRQELKLCADRMDTKVAYAEAEGRLYGMESVVALQGWVLARKVPELEASLEKFDCAWELCDPEPEEYPEVPVQLRNNKITNALNMVTNMYSLPAYGTVDPNPLMAPFFILFYGIMMADMGYGLLMMLASVVVLRRMRPKGTMSHFFGLLGLCGVSTFLMGAVTGGFFGDMIPQVLKILNPESTFVWFWPPLFTPLDDTLMILVGAMALGLIQIVTGMAISFIKKIREGQILDAVWEELTWWIVFAGLALAVLGVTNVVIILGGVMVLVGSGWNAKGFGKVTAVFGSLYNHVTGYFGDILSYSRLMALMLAGSVIAQVFNTLGAIPGNLVIFFIISLAGNALNFALNLLGCYVHDLRLQCLEFFGRFYKEGGRPYRPLDIDTKYVNVIKEEE